MQGRTPRHLPRGRHWHHRPCSLTTFNQDLSLFTALARGCTQICASAPGAIGHSTASVPHLKEPGMVTERDVELQRHLERRLASLLEEFEQWYGRPVTRAP